MKRFRALPILCLVLPLAACITTKPRSAQPTSAASVIESVPVRTWGDNTCGSGALSAVLNHYGDPATEAELDEAFPKGRNGGVVSVDLLLETRRRGFDAQLLRLDEETLIKTIDAGTPAILMLQVVDLPGSSRDFFHYVIADGWDPEAGLMRFQFGDGKTRWVRPSKLAKPWEKAGNATLVVRPLPLQEALRRAVLLEEKGSFDTARESYRMLTRHHPDSPVVWTNLGNVEARLQAAEEAEQAYRRALEIDPEESDALNNLAWLLYTEQRLEEAETLARRAVAAASADLHLPLDTLGHVLVARGSCREAADAFRRALESPSIGEEARAEAERQLRRSESGCATS